MRYSNYKYQLLRSLDEKSIIWCSNLEDGNFKSSFLNSSCKITPRNIWISQINHVPLVWHEAKPDRMYESRRFTTFGALRHPVLQDKISWVKCYWMQNFPLYPNLPGSFCTHLEIVAKISIRVGKQVKSGQKATRPQSALLFYVLKTCNTSVHG